MSLRDELYKFTAEERTAEELKSFSEKRMGVSVRQVGKGEVLLKVKDSPWMSIQDWRVNFQLSETKKLNDLALRLMSVFPQDELTETLPLDVKQYLVQVGLGQDAWSALQELYNAANDVSVSEEDVYNAAYRLADVMMGK